MPSTTSSLPEGFTLREATSEDVQPAAAVLRAEEEDLRGRSHWGLEETAHLWRLANLGASALVEATDGATAAVVVAVDRGGAREAWVTVHPDFTGRGLATALLPQVEQHARAAGMEKLKMGAFSENDGARKLFERHGFREARHYYGMRIDFDRPPSPPSWPTGIEVSTFRPQDARAFHQALGESFEDEWGFHQPPFEQWKRERLEAPDTDTSLWFVVREGEEIAAVARCDPKREGGGWVGALGVRKPWRKRGIGLALLEHTLVEFHRRGESHVGLGVDTQNPSGATRLYERAGMRVINEDVVYEKDLT
jgi:ribosomal protein S18 acetylase RimI-like enzyme